MPIAKATPVRIVMFFTLLLLQAGAFAQALTQQAVKADIDVYAANYPRERVYIQFDKPAYAPGETIWFKAYLMKGFDVSDQSKTLYVDFADDDGNVLMHGVYPVWEASAAGYFDVAVDYKGKSLHVRACTKWMLNFDSAFLYNKDIRIITKAIVGTKPAAKPVLAASVQFFPEGGDCIEGLKTKIAFKANYQNGLPADISGIVADSKGNVIDSIKSQHDGMGFFYVEAHAGETYTAKWADNAGVGYQTPLPPIKSAGAAMEINPGRQRTGFVIRRQDNAPDEMKQVHVVATMQQQVVYMATVNLAESPISGGTIPTVQFSSGIMQITLFDANWKPVAERISFVNNHDYRFEPSVGFDTVALTPRGKNVLTVDVPDSVGANLSLSVTDMGLGIDSSDDIISHLLLTGDLKGRVYRPGYYFSNNSDSVAKHLDLVMLTNGWRRFKWADVTVGKLPAVKYPRDSTYLNFSGQVFGATPKQIKDAGGLIAFISPKGKDSSRQFVTVPLNSNGSFSKPGLIFFDTLKVYYQFISKGGAGLSNTVEVNFNSGITSPGHLALNKTGLGFLYTDTTGNYRNSVLAAEQARLQELLKSTTLQNVTVTTRLKSRMEQMDDKYTNGLFAGNGFSTQFDVVNDPLATGATDVFSYLTGRVAGLSINNVGSPQVSIMYRGTPVSVYVDQIPSDLNSVADLNMNDVAYIKLLPPPFFGGFSLTGGGQGGALAIYTRRGDDVRRDANAKGLQYKLVTGYTASKEFYSPDYSNISQPNMQEDIRSTLYWNPLIITTPKNHRVTFSFYNNDVTGSLRVILEGVNKDGKFARVEKLVN